MLQEERYSEIYEILKQRGSATVQFLSRQLFVSEATIRRDLEVMEERGLIRRIWGGAMLPAAGREIPPFARIKSNSDKKKKIAAIAAPLLKNSMSVSFDSSTSCLALVPYIAKLKDIIVITSSLLMSKQLTEQTSAEVILTGGMVYENYVLSGLSAIDNIKRYHTDICFFSCSGISTHAGITSVDHRVVEVCREMMKNSSLSVLLCDTSKVGKTALVRLAELSDPDYIIMDKVPDDPELVSLLGDRLITDSRQLRGR